MIFQDRKDAGLQLAKRLTSFKEFNPKLLASPRGGVPIAFEVAKVLKAPLEVFVSRKIGHPGDPEYAIGAIAEGGEILLDNHTIIALKVPQAELEKTILKEQSELERRVKPYREGRSLPEIKDKTVILIDDGIATGMTIKASLLSLIKQKPKKIICAAPVCAYETSLLLQKIADATVFLHVPPSFKAVGSYYHEFDQVSDEEVIWLKHNLQ